ncbi:MAG: nitroreductase family protein [Eubacterium sp.]|nr:nitroreductase family protein [Eubacterium sp.]
MELANVLRNRFSVRKYKSTPIGDAKLNTILEAGRIAPTAANHQCQRVFVLKSDESIRKIRSITKCAFDAPIVLMIGYDKNEQWENPFESGVTSGEQDASIVAMQMMLKAWDLGIGSCWVNYFPPTETAKAFDIPDNVRIVLLLTLGYADDGVRPAALHSQKKALEETVTTL